MQQYKYYHLFEVRFIISAFARVTLLLSILVKPGVTSASSSASFSSRTCSASLDSRFLITGLLFSRLCRNFIISSILASRYPSSPVASYLPFTPSQTSSSETPVALLFLVIALLWRSISTVLSNSFACFSSNSLESFLSNRAFRRSILSFSSCALTLMRAGRMAEGLLSLLTLLVFIPRCIATFFKVFRGFTTSSSLIALHS
mmetsp:Transcript_18288/g.25351  ORF Transcript_18288/g.25351 Transcript_18288/m.25351 type:complete len:202 (+) Transcript_18288:114-719(+)